MKRSFVSALLFFVSTGVSSCHRGLPELPTWQPIGEPDAASVESVIFLIGDAGQATTDGDAILHRLRQDVEDWSRQLPRDSSVAVLFLGDNIYPRGLRDRSDSGFANDSINLMGQIDVVGTASAVARQNFAIFISGNHDWGQAPSPSGLARLQNQAAFLDQRRGEGRRVALLPQAGTANVGVVDIGASIRLLLLDTAWWLLGSDAEGRTNVLKDMESAMRTRGRREVIIAAHHPFKSAASHGGFVPIWQSLGVRMLLARSGAWLQDLNSIPYRQFKDNATQIFRRTKPPLMFVGGHDHALQVITASNDDEPRFMLGSGAGSKMSPVGYTDGMRYRDSGPGYMRVVFLKDGGVLLFVTAASGSNSTCSKPDTPECRDEVAKFKTTYSIRIK